MTVYTRLTACSSRVSEDQLRSITSNDNLLGEPRPDSQQRRRPCWRCGALLISSQDDRLAILSLACRSTRKLQCRVCQAPNRSLARTMANASVLHETRAQVEIRPRHQAGAAVNADRAYHVGWCNANAINSSSPVRTKLLQIATAPSRVQQDLARTSLNTLQAPAHHAIQKVQQCGRLV